MDSIYPHNVPSTLSVILSLQKLNIPTSFFSSSSSIVNTSVLPFSHLSLESEERANHEGNVQLHTALSTRVMHTRPEFTTSTLTSSAQLNMTPPTRALDTHPETTPSIVNMAPRTRALSTHPEIIPSTLPGNI